MPNRALDIFMEAVELSGPDRAAYLDEACGDDAALRDEVENLMLAEAEAGEFLLATEGANRDAGAPARVASGSIGRYRLLQEIGEGGFGVVYVAEQSEPVRRRVAVKIIKLGMDTKQVIARFEAERQALALMDHPNIAKVLDAGATDEGRPYFVMEYIKGVPFIDYCDGERLDTVARLGLFCEVCRAIQHAHQKGIIHRDIKPSNVLVTLQDGEPVPKVIDFGIAKATNVALTQKTLFTEHRQIIGTPAYMSPEQAEMSGLDIDTRSDVYSLGVLLYELLTGTTPFTQDELRSAGKEGMLRLIREVEPEKPSTRLSSLSATAPQAAERGRASAQRLRSDLKGDLDWIVMKCLEKNRDRRYDTPNAVVTEITRYLSNEPVLAGPPSVSYRVGKFLLRHRGAVVAGSLIAGSLVIATGVSIGFGVMATRQRDRAELLLTQRDEALAAEQTRADELDQVASFQAEQLGGIDAAAMGVSLRDGLRGKLEALASRRGLDDTGIQAMLAEFDRMVDGADTTGLALDLLETNVFKPALETIDRDFEDQPLLRARLLQTVSETLIGLGMYDLASGPQQRALTIFREALGGEHPDTLLAINNTGFLLEARGQPVEAERYHREALETRRRVLGEEDRLTLASMNNLGMVLRAQGKPAQAEPYLREALEVRRRVLGHEHSDTVTSTHNLGMVLSNQGRFAEAEPFYREALEIGRRVFSDEDTQPLVTLNGLGALLQAQGRLAEAEDYYLEALGTSRRLLGDDHPRTLTSINNMGTLLQSQGRLAEAEPYYTEVLGTSRRVLGNEHPRTLSTISNLALLLAQLGRGDEALVLADESLEIGRRALPEGHWLPGNFLGKRGRALQALGRYEEAADSMLNGHAILAESLGVGHPQTRRVVEYLADLYTQWHRAEPGQGYDVEAEAWRARLAD